MSEHTFRVGHNDHIPTGWNYKEITPGKGIQGENCNVTACQKPKSAFHYNKVMKKWYCLQCAEKIEHSAKMGGMSFYDDLPTKSLLTPK